MLRFLGIALALALLAAPALAKNPHHQQDRHEYDGGADLGEVFITELERALIRDYYRDNPRYAGGQRLPPGIAKNLARGKPLPPGIAKKMPPGLAARLHARPGYEYRAVGADVVLVQIATGVIVDILRGAMR